jgi:hypothetical protein
MIERGEPVAVLMGRFFMLLTGDALRTDQLMEAGGFGSFPFDSTDTLDGATP